MGQHGKLIWFTGLSGAGKSTLANLLDASLHGLGFKTYVLDGDLMRKGLNKDLSFSDSDRRENIRRAGEVSALMVDAGIIVISALISPFDNDRQDVRKLVGENNFVEVFVDAPLEVCERRDVKGLYEKARKGMIPNFTGIDSPYEVPQSPFITVRTDILSAEDSADLLLKAVLPRISRIR